MRILIFLLLAISSSCQAQIDWSEQYQTVSIAELISHPEVFNNRKISVFGFIHFGAHEGLITLTEKHCFADSASGVVIDRSGSFYRNSGESVYRNADIKYNGRWGRIKGTFAGNRVKVAEDGLFITDRVLKEIADINICKECGELSGPSCPNPDSPCCVYPISQEEKPLK